MDNANVKKLKDLLKIKGNDFLFKEFIVEEMKDSKIRKQKINFPYLESKLDLKKFLDPEFWDAEEKDTEWYLSLEEKRINVSYSQKIGKLDVIIEAGFLFCPPDELAFCLNHYYLWMGGGAMHGLKNQLSSLSIDEMEWKPSPPTFFDKLLFTWKIQK